MLKAVITDFSRVLLFPADDSYQQGLNSLNRQLLESTPNYDFWKYFQLNEELLTYYTTLTLPKYIFTSDSIQDHPAVNKRLKAVFKEILSAKVLNVSKSDSKTYAAIAKLLDLKPNEIIYIDDNHNNIDAAKKAGCETILYKSNEDVIGKIAQG
ncbi:MAG TPA: HAD-IA family hydrolase [Candidatus Saccharibacteria bacterium]|nr:HAD-IA family hydrolase [Candidatus Saccharibacteria bacterium]